MMSEEITEVKYQYKHFFIFLLIVLLGLVLIIADEFIQPGWGRDAVASLAQTIFMIGLLSVIYERFLREDIMNMVHGRVDKVKIEIKESITSVGISVREGAESIKEKLVRDDSLDQLGLIRVFPSSNKFDYDELFESPSKLYVMMNDGRTWCSVHSSALSKRLSNPDLTTIFMLIHVNSPFLDILSTKLRTTPEALRRKITETIGMLEGYASEGHSHIEVFGHMLPTTYSLVLNDTLAVLTPYPIIEKSDDIPAYIYKSGKGSNFYNVVRKDFFSLLKASTKMLPESLL